MSASAVMWASSNAPSRSSLSLLSSTRRSHIEVSDLPGAREKLCEQDLRANVPLLSVGTLAPLNHLGPGELIVEEISLVLVNVGHDRRAPCLRTPQRILCWRP